jgi:hypothetical protein
MMKRIAFLSAFALVCASFTFVLKEKNDETDAQRKASFKDLLAQFPEGNLPFEITQNDFVKEFERLKQEQKTPYDPEAPTKEKPKRLDWKYAELLPHGDGRFSRMPTYIVPIKKFETADNFAVLYILEQAYGVMQGQYFISTFDKKGALVSTHLFAHFNRKQALVAAVNSDLLVNQKELAINWAEDASATALLENSVLGFKLNTTKIIDLTLQTADKSQKTPVIRKKQSKEVVKEVAKPQVEGKP